MKVTLVASLIAITASAASAQTWNTYDPNTGNSMNHTRNGMGTHTTGINTRTGTMWQLQQNNTGTYHGIDGSGNFFSGNSNTGFYQNSDGTTCIGTGYARTCN